MFFHGVINHLILVWEYLYTIFSSVDVKKSTSWHSCSRSFCRSSYLIDTSVFLSYLLLQYIKPFYCFLLFIFFRCKGNIIISFFGLSLSTLQKCTYTMLLTLILISVLRREISDIGLVIRPVIRFISALCSSVFSLLCF